jgi:hypothetical protein
MLFTSEVVSKFKMETLNKVLDIITNIINSKNTSYLAPPYLSLRARKQRNAFFVRNSRLMF